MPISATIISAMIELSLKEFLAQGTQKEVAEQLGVTQGAISQMLAAGRDVRIRVDAKGRIVSAHEVKPLGRSSRAA